MRKINLVKRNTKGENARDSDTKAIELLDKNRKFMEQIRSKCSRIN
ncbi:MAG: hypothetical protein IPO23_10075 [Flavobacterium sp.]|nr:hypothetical protein [Flavobacterium sp.]